MIPRFFLLFSIFCLIVLKACDTNNSSNAEVKKFWKRYVKVVKSKDFEELKAISLPKIDCRSCLDNSAKEDSAVTNFKIKNPDSWYDQLYGELVYIPIDKFIEQDFDILFDQDLLSKIKNSSKVIFISRELEKKEGQQYLTEYIEGDKIPILHEALVTTVDPSTQYEGEQVVIQFLETNLGLRFYGYTTIP
ncbi:MAG TPA: hypothetical protein VD908_07635 [Cytophagales bacterium]|nr:hypothetical protein [Cytophagales bacterium]